MQETGPFIVAANSENVTPPHDACILCIQFNMLKICCCRRCDTIFHDMVLNSKYKVFSVGGKSSASVSIVLQLYQNRCSHGLWQLGMSFTHQMKHASSQKRSRSIFEPPPSTIYEVEKHGGGGVMLHELEMFGAAVAIAFVTRANTILQIIGFLCLPSSPPPSTFVPR